MLEHRQVGHIFKRVRCLDIYVQSTDFILFFQSTDFNVSNQFLFFPKKKKKNGKEISTAMCWNQPSVSAIFCFWPRVGSAVGTERNLIHVG